MKTLVIVAHPHLQKSKVNARWVKAVKENIDITVHDLYEEYPQEVIDIHKEQQQLTQHERIVFQFPFYWYSSPPLLKKWIDTVFTAGWAYGSGGNKLHGKELVLAISTGSPEEKYQAGGLNQYTVSELTRPFQATSSLVGMTFLPMFIFHNAFSATDTDIEESAKNYVRHILNPELNPKLKFIAKG
ncbi:NAD(P)H-dependent oxidoreductase [Aneurinibacillus sp. REN35]|uniref:NAD(P)H-dependent oxidoreductase n=1 Tax=Aneurinibacillus sp. REN35 TaxID=3237286 RepID=UPI0035287746